jgi:hypothetical protein
MFIANFQLPIADFPAPKVFQPAIGNWQSQIA